jgi:hypothetical protein
MPVLLYWQIIATSPRTGICSSGFDAGHELLLRNIFEMARSAGSAVAETPVAEVSHLQIYSSFWQNLHHYLYATGLFDLAWPAFKAAVERYVRAFVDGKEPVDRMAADLIEMLP